MGGCIQEGRLAQVPHRMGTVHGTGVSPPQLPTLQLFPLCGGFGNQCGVGRTHQDLGRKIRVPWHLLASSSPTESHKPSLQSHTSPVLVL